MAKQPTSYVWTYLQGRFTRETKNRGLFVPTGGMEEFWVPTSELGIVIYREAKEGGGWQRSGPLRLNAPVEDFQIPDWLADRYGLSH
jgi:hypothetical protein